MNEYRKRILNANITSSTFEYFGTVCDQDRSMQKNGVMMEVFKLQTLSMMSPSGRIPEYT